MQTNRYIIYDHSGMTLVCAKRKRFIIIGYGGIVAEIAGGKADTFN